jgi:hypothetical protein
MVLVKWFVAVDAAVGVCWDWRGVDLFVKSFMQKWSAASNHFKVPNNSRTFRNT